MASVSTTRQGSLHPKASVNPLARCCMISNCSSAMWPRSCLYKQVTDALHVEYTQRQGGGQKEAANRKRVYSTAWASPTRNNNQQCDMVKRCTLQRKHRRMIAFTKYTHISSTIRLPSEA